MVRSPSSRSHRPRSHSSIGADFRSPSLSVVDGGGDVGFTLTRTVYLLPAAAPATPGSATITNAARLYEPLPRIKGEIRESQTNLESILESKVPVTVTRQGEALGVIVPVGVSSAASALVRSRSHPKRTSKRPGEQARRWKH